MLYEVQLMELIQIRIINIFLLVVQDLLNQMMYIQEEIH